MCLTFFFLTKHDIFKICPHCNMDISFFAPDHCLIFHGEFPATHPPWVGTKDAFTSHTRNDAGTDAVFLGTSLGGSVENFSGAVFQEEGHGVVLRVHSPGLSAKPMVSPPTPSTALPASGPSLVPAHFLGTKRTGPNPCLPVLPLSSPCV